MKKHTTFKLVILALLFATGVMAATISRVTTFSDGDVLTAAQLNAEFDNVVDGVNSINNDNIVNNAAIAPSKISAAIKGDAISRNSTSGALSVNPDGSTIEISSDAIRVKDAGITGAKLATSAADATTLEVASGSMRIKDSGVSTAKIASSAVTTAKVNDGAITQAKKVVRLLTATTAAVGDVAIDSLGTVIFTTSSSFVDTGLEVSLTTLGSVVHVSVGPSTNGFVGAMSSLGASLCEWRILRNGATTVATATDSSAAAYENTNAFFVFEKPSAGVNTYKLQYRRVNAFGSGCFIQGMDLTAYEL